MCIEIRTFKDRKKNLEKTSHTLFILVLVSFSFKLSFKHFILKKLSLKYMQFMH